MRLKTFAVLAAVILATRSAFAVTYSDNNPADVWLNAFNPSYTGTFDLVGDGYNPATQQVYSAVATFTLWDGVLSESWNLTLGGEAFLSGGSFSSVINMGGGVFGSALVDLSTDGILSYTITRTSGEFWLTNASLVANAGPSGAGSVPDGGQTSLLLASGLVALGALRRFRKSAS
jgi:hypothetical protein